MQHPSDYRTGAKTASAKETQKKIDTEELKIDTLDGPR
jgi:hypothetical protein